MLASEVRVGIDRDEDGFYDRDELDVCSEPADPAVTPRTSSCAFVRGDCDADGSVDVSDAVALLLALFRDAGRPPCGDACDLNDDGAIDIMDPISGLGFLFKHDPPPALPFTTCGADPTEDDLDCDTFPICR